jgi:M6 family metalloprotease-like protein
MGSLALRRLGATAGLILSGAVALVGPMVPVVHADNAATDCILPLAGKMGAIDYDTYVRPVGTVKAVLLFVDFSDAPATTPADHLYEDTFGQQPLDWLSTSSYGKLDFQVTPIRHWLRIADPMSSFTFPGGAPAGADGRRYISEALAAADPEVDFKAYRIVIIQSNKEATALTGADTRAYNVSDAIPIDGTLVRNVETLGSVSYKYGPKVLDHETGHAFGVTDYYLAGGTPAALYADAGDWSMMSDSYDDNDHLSFDKWRYGWLANAQIACVNDETDDDYVLSPLATDDDGVKAVVLRTGLQSAIVAEYRVADGNDANICSEGVLIYRVDSGSGVRPVRVVDSLPGTGTGNTGCDLELWDAPFVDGDTFTDEPSGIEIDVTATGDGEATIHVTRSSTYTAPVRYGRSVTIKAVRNASGTTTISGVLTAARHFAACQAGRSVALQRLVGTVWVTAKSLRTNSLATLTYTFRATPGVYRLLAIDYPTSTYDCLPGASKALTVR